MPNENNPTPTPTPEAPMSAEEYIAQLQQLREQTVSRDEYNRIAADNRRLANALANGTVAPISDDKEKPDVAALGKELFSAKKKSNLEYFKGLLQLRDAVIDAGEPDPFLPANRQYVPNAADAERAQEIADILGECIEYADGDPRVFTVELQRRCRIKK